MSEMEMQARGIWQQMPLVGIDLDNETIREGMLMVTAAGTAVQIEKIHL
jgi:uncharacterized protein YbjQ (UPF0145 family)